MTADTLAEVVARALAEDVGAGDITAAALVPADARGRARITQKQAGVIFGLDAAREVFSQTGSDEPDALALEGEWRDGVPAPVLEVSGSARSLLAAERVALNLLSHLSGVATLSARFVAAVSRTDALIRIASSSPMRWFCAPPAATAAFSRLRSPGVVLRVSRITASVRLTAPGLRSLEKAAVAAGGAQNHRMGLDDAILIKENHAAFAGGVGAAVTIARSHSPNTEVVVECRNAAELSEALAAGPDRAMLDNMGPEDLRRAAQARDLAVESGAARTALEASGGITLENAAEIAATGVDFISVGALTHSAAALDLSMILEPE